MPTRLDMTLVRAGLAGRAGELGVALLGDPNRGMSTKRELRFGRHGSVGVVISGKKAGTWFDHELGTGGDMLALIMRERDGSFRDAVLFAEEFVGRAPVTSPPARLVRPASDDASDSTRNIAIAADIWRAAVPIADTIAIAYLASRGIRDLPAGVDGQVLRFHASCSYGGAKRPCMVALLRDIVTDEPRAIQRTALTATGEKIGRLTLGPKTGTAIKLSDNADVTNRLTVGEGCETVLAGMALGYMPAWALGDAGELAAFPVLAGIESITVLVDNDQSGTGQDAALKCSARWTAAGREVFRLVPCQVGNDVADLVRDQNSSTVTAP
jgi:putative DNA primase/helicase